MQKHNFNGMAAVVWIVSHHYYCKFIVREQSPLDRSQRFVWVRLFSRRVEGSIDFDAVFPNNSDLPQSGTKNIIFMG